jgi:predicted lipoprotein with Yx(FWY)xxD motif
MKVKATLIALLLVGAFAGCSTMMSESAPAHAQGGVLVDAKGMTLYTFDKDPANSGKSVCVNQCAKAWPPLAAPADAKAMGDYSVITRSDGSKQWAYKGKPLYTWVKDTKPGDMTGDGFRNVWRVAHP